MRVDSIRLVRSYLYLSLVWCHPHRVQCTMPYCSVLPSCSQPNVSSRFFGALVLISRLSDVLDGNEYTQTQQWMCNASHSEGIPRQHLRTYIKPSS
ncbi:hypothetical protein BXZ70DRAFT_447103 [Cristinia sonorae]|uniref:Uncharacterized protein n=1 Tax=Cristinia sonorae TaxID=1940300 RepID=A0A8K0UK01_9AGAR|nr:hypothetical protein BXZ70DRAFT_447103 [Cristinia sonorae]